MLGLERHEPAHDKGSSHGGSRIIRQAYFEDPGYVPLLLRAYELWEKLAADSQRDVYRLTGGLFIGPPDCLIVSGSLRASRQWNLPHELLDAAEITARFPNFTPHPEDIALYDPKAGFARPELTVRAHLEIAEKAGATLQFGEPVLDWKSDRRRDTGHYESWVLHRWAVGDLPGAWAPQVLGESGVPITVERQVMYWLDPTGGASRFKTTPSSSTRAPPAYTHTASRRSTDRGAV